MTGCNHGKSDDELTRKDLFDVIEIYKKENTELKKQLAITKEKIIEVLKDYYFEDEEDIKLFNKMANEILGEDNGLQESRKRHS